MVPPIAAHIAGHAANASMAEIEAPIAGLVVVTERYTAPIAPAPTVERIAILFLLNLLPLLFSELVPPQLIHILQSFSSFIPYYHSWGLNIHLAM
jgi:hypothetical protein